MLFFHFFPRGMAEALDSANWPALLGIEELAWVVPAKSAGSSRRRTETARPRGAGPSLRYKRLIELTGGISTDHLGAEVALRNIVEIRSR